MIWGKYPMQCLKIIFFLFQYADRTYPMLILGSLMFIPGFYHVRIAYYAWKGYRGYSFDDIPDFDWQYHQKIVMRRNLPLFYFKIRKSQKYAKVWAPGIHGMAVWKRLVVKKSTSLSQWTLHTSFILFFF